MTMMMTNPWAACTLAFDSVSLTHSNNQRLGETLSKAAYRISASHGDIKGMESDVNPYVYPAHVHVSEKEWPSCHSEVNEHEADIDSMLVEVNHISMARKVQIPVQ